MPIEPEEQAFRDQMAADPHDAHTRAVYADWLDEHGQGEPARRLRLWAMVLPHIVEKNFKWATPNEGAEQPKFPVWLRQLVHQRHFREFFKDRNDESSSYLFRTETLPASELKALGLDVIVPKHAPYAASEEWVRDTPNGSHYAGLLPQEEHAAKVAHENQMKLARPEDHDRVAEDIKTYRQHVRPRFPTSQHGIFNTAAEHPFMHAWFTNRGLKVQKGDYTYYDEQTHTLHHTDPEDKSAVVHEYLKSATKHVKLARGDSEEQAFQHTLEHNPHDHTAKLIYADWLQEHGADESAQKLRTWAKLHRALDEAGPDKLHSDRGRFAPWVRQLLLVHRARNGITDHLLHNSPVGRDVLLPALGSIERHALGVGTGEDMQHSAERVRVHSNATNAYDRAYNQNDPEANMTMVVHHLADHAMDHPIPSGGAHMDHAEMWADGAEVPRFERAAKDHLYHEKLSRVGQMKSDTHNTRLAVARHVLTEAGVSPAQVMAVLAHTDARGVRPGVAAMVGKPLPPVLARYVASWMGLLTGEKQMTVFHPGDGEDTLHIIDSPHTSEHVGEYLKRAGVKSFSMQAKGAGTRAFIVSPMDLGDVQNAANGLQGQHSAVRGTAVRLGAGTDAGARSAYRQVIDDAEKAAEQPVKLAAIPPAGSTGSELVRVPVPTPVQSKPKQPAPAQPSQPPPTPTQGPTFILPG